jgi:leucyl aminopeptidase (aminopeptidase T)
MSDTTPDLTADAELIVDTCMSVEGDDVVTVIADDDHRDQADAIAALAADRGAKPVVANNEQQVRRAKADTRYPMAPPENLHRAMVNSDEVIIVTDLEWANRFAHVDAVKANCENDAKIASVEEGVGSWELTDQDIEEATRRARDAIDVLEDSDRVRVTSPAGTDVEISIEDRPALEVTPIKERGEMMGPVPLWSEVAFAAVEDETTGQFVVDGVMLGIGLDDQVDEEIVWTLEDGRAVDIEGGEEAERLRETIDGVDGADVVGEYAFGTSYHSPFGTPSEKGRIGTVHFALGDNHNAYPGGQNVSDLHLDGVCLNASMWTMDTGVDILDEGEWVL